MAKVEHEGATIGNEAGDESETTSRHAELRKSKESYVALLTEIKESLSSAFPTIADTQLKPTITRAIEVIDELTGTDVSDAEKIRQLEEELGVLELDMMRGMRAKHTQDRDVRIGGIFKDAHGASEDHTVVIPPNWEQNVQ